MSVQRRRGQRVKIWRTVTTENRRGIKVKSAVEDGPHYVTAVFIPERGQRAEVVGQQSINVNKMIVAAELEGVELWSRVEWAGRMWDIVTPPSLHWGTRRTRHWSMDIRERP